MNPIEFKEQNLLLGAGDNPNTDDMPVAVSTQEFTGDSILHSVSCWQLSPEELAEIQRTGVLWLSTMGWPPPPIVCMSHNPFDTHNYKALDLNTPQNEKEA